MCKQILICSFVGVLLVTIGTATVVAHSSKDNRLPQKIAPGFGAISGIVVGEDGKPVANAKVYAMLTDQLTNGRVNSVLTDGHGRFVLDRVSSGLNTVHASKEEDGYPDTFFAFYVTDPRAIPQVFVSEHSVASVTVKLGPRAGKISIQISDLDTDESIDDSTVELRRSSDPSVYVSLSCIPDANGKCEIFASPLPSRIRVSKAGYEEQDLTEKLGAENPIANLKSGEKKDLKIRLRRSKSGKR